MIILGFIGFKCHVKIADLGDHIDCFKRVLNNGSENNINALRFLILSYQRMGNATEALKYQRTLDQLEHGSSEKMKNRLMARSHIEYVIFVSCLDETFLNKHHEDIVEKFQKCIQIGIDNGVEKLEINFWKFALGFLYVRMDSILKPKQGPQDGEWLRKILAPLYEVAQSETGESSFIQANVDCKAKAWSYMGVLLIRRYKKRKFSLHQINKEYENLTGFECFENALRISPNTPSVLRRIGQAYMKTCNLKKAEGYLKKAEGYLLNAIKAQPLGYAYSLLGQCHLAMFKNSEARDKVYLEKAIDNLERARENQCDMFSLYKSLAIAYELNGNLDKALNVYVACEDTHEGPRNAELYELWAKLLESANNTSAATEKRQMAQDTRDGKNPREMRDFGVVYDDSDVKQVVQFVQDLEHSMKITGYFKERDLKPGKAELDALEEMAKTCRVIFVFCTKNFNSSSEDLKQLIDHSRKEGASGPIVPLVVGNPKLPVCIKHRHKIKYDGSDECTAKLDQLFDGGRTGLRERLVNIFVNEVSVSRPKVGVFFALMSFAFLNGLVADCLLNYTPDGMTNWKYLNTGTLFMSFANGMLCMGLIDKFKPVTDNTFKYVGLSLVSLIGGLAISLLWGVCTYFVHQCYCRLFSSKGNV